MDDDLDLIKRTVAGDREAFDELVRRHQRQLYAMLFRMVGNQEDAADLMQRAFVKAFTGLGSFERRSSFKTWLYRIAINLAKNTYRDRARAEYVSIDDVVLSRNPRTLDALIVQENRSLVRKALAGLPEKQRTTLILRIQGEKKFEEIADLMQCSVGTAKANYHHAVQKLKALMERGAKAEKDRS